MVEKFVNTVKEIAEKTKELSEYTPNFLKGDFKEDNSKIDILKPLETTDTGLTETQKHIIVREYGWSIERVETVESWEAFEKETYKSFSEDLEQEGLTVDDLFDDEDDELIELASEYESYSQCPLEGHGGHWEGFKGDSKWEPNRDEVPKNPKTNPEGLTWGEIMDKYGIDGIEFHDGEPDFSPVSKGTVEIDNFSDKRLGKGCNFDQATKKLAEQRGCTEKEVKDWMKENKYTWHERSDCKTMEKVPTEVHGNVRHSGGVSAIKQSQKEEA